MFYFIVIILLIIALTNLIMGYYLNDVVDFVGEENVGYNTVSEELWIKSFGNWALVPGGYYIIAGLPGEYYIVSPYNFEKGM